MLIFEGKVGNGVVEYFNNFLEQTIESKFLNKKETTCTFNGFQTINVIDFINKKYLEEIIELTKTYINNFYDNNLEYYKFYISHIHLIKYKSNGFQEGHTHNTSEDHSFILYLNDLNNSGATRMYLNNQTIDIFPQKNKLILFNSNIFHEGLKCDGEKKVLVGAIRFCHKIWR